MPYKDDMLKNLAVNNRVVGSLLAPALQNHMKKESHNSFDQSSSQESGYPSNAHPNMSLNDDRLTQKAGILSVAANDILSTKKMQDIDESAVIEDDDENIELLLGEGGGTETA